MRAEQVAAERAHAGPHLADRQRLGPASRCSTTCSTRPSPCFDRRPQHPSVAGGVVEHRGDGRGRVAAAEMCGDQLCSVSLRSNGVSPGSTMIVESSSRSSPGIAVMPDHRGIAGAALHGLLDEGDMGPARRLLLHLLGDPLGAVPDHHDRAIDIDVGQGMDDVHDHRTAADLVQRLRAGGAHSRALARRQHDRRNCHASVLARRGAKLV